MTAIINAARAAGLRIARWAYGRAVMADHLRPCERVQWIDHWAGVIRHLEAKTRGAA